MSKIIGKLSENYQVFHLRKILNKINALSEKMKKLSDDDLRNQTNLLRGQYNEGIALDDILPEAFAAIREACYRILGLYAYDVQMMGAIALHEEKIAEMKTGEGKTLTAVMPLYLNGLTGEGAMLVTANEFLADRDGREMQEVLGWMGLKVEIGVPNEKYPELDFSDKQRIYAADIVYTTHSALGFDYLMDNLSINASQKFMKKVDFIIIDEVDDVLIDSARTPLVISGSPRVQSNLYSISRDFVNTLKPKIDFKVDDEKNGVWLTKKGINYAEEYFKLMKLYTAENFELARHINLALRAKSLFEKDYQYLIESNEIKLIDVSTGRKLNGTKLQGGIHQAIEAKEYLEISKLNRSTGSITFQHLFKKFNRIAGMTGTAYTSKKEFFEIYGMDVIKIPTNKTNKRRDLPHRVYVSESEKIEAVIKTVKKVHSTGQPILLATESIQVSRMYSNLLLKAGISHNLLNAYHIANEAEMIKDAGKKNSVTISTAIAGRGTDIRLDKEAKKLGGLYMIGTEVMSNVRIELQLRGRSGRQGDPGVSQFYVSLDEELVEQWASKAQKKKRETLRRKGRVIKPNSWRYNQAIKAIQFSQSMNEEREEYSRKRTLEFDESLNLQREIVYEERNKILDGRTDVEELAIQLIEEVIEDFSLTSKHFSQRNLSRFVLENIDYQYYEKSQNDIKQSDVKDFLMEIVKEALYHKNEQLLGQKKAFYKMAILKAIDESWIEQVDYLQQLKSIVSHRHVAQKNPMIEYHQEASVSYEKMNKQIKKIAMRNILLSTVSFEGDNLNIFFG